MSADESPPTRESLAESPWLWGGLFAAMAILALVVVAPKYAQRQGRLEQRFENRIRTAQQQQQSAGDQDPLATGPAAEPMAPMRDARARTSLRPLLLVVLGLLFASVMLLVLRRRRAR